MTQRELFLQHIAQTSTSPLALEIVRAEGSMLFDAEGREFIDLIGGISVANMGHRHPKVVEAIKNQLDAYLHIMVYGEFIEAPQVQYARLLTEHLPSSLNTVYFTNSGSEATEGAMKLAKRITGRTQIIAFNNSYHGSTQGALSIMGSEYWRNAFRPLLPGISHFEFNSPEVIEAITEETACIIMETIQAEAGIILPSKEWLVRIREKCSETGTLLILDEIQSGFGRTGKLWAFEHFGVVPDILLLGKALGGGMPLGAFISDQKLMSVLSDNPVLGHITTFGGHPVSCAAGMAAFKALLSEGIIEQIEKKEKVFRDLLVHSKIKSVRSSGLWAAVELDSFETTKKIVDNLLKLPGQSNLNTGQGLRVLSDWFLFAPHCLRISPPLIITEELVRQACMEILKAAEAI